MRIALSMIPLMLAACEPWPWKEPVETDDPDTTGTLDTSAESGDPTGGDDTGESGGVESADSGGLPEEDVVEEACASLGEEVQVCCLLMRRGSNPAIAAVDPEVGGAGVTVVALGSLDLPSLGVANLGREGNKAYTCTGDDPPHTIDLVSGALETLSGDSCIGITPWRGDAPYDGGIALLGEGGMLTYYPGVESLLDGIPDDYLGDIGTGNGRLAMEGDVLYNSGHSTNEVERLLLPEMEEQEPLTLEDFDTWIWGLSVVNGVLYLIDDGRGESETELTSTRLLSFDAETGAQLGHVYLDDGSEWFGLHCEAR